MSPSTAKPRVLDLDAELTREQITFQGNTYELRNRSELSILETNQLARLRQQYSGLVGADEISDEDAEKIGVTVHEVAAMLLVDAPSEELPDQLCMKIMRFWSEQYAAEDGDDGNPPPPRPRRAPQDRQKKKPTARQRARSTGAR